jgi:hypothetical protein
MRDYEGRRHDLEAKDTCGGCATEVSADKSVVVTGLLAEGTFYTVEDFD